MKTFNAEDYEVGFFTRDLPAGEQFRYVTRDCKTHDIVALLLEKDSERSNYCPSCCLHNYECCGTDCDVRLVKHLGILNKRER